MARASRPWFGKSSSRRFSPRNPPSQGLRRTGREHPSAEASSEGESSHLQFAEIRPSAKIGVEIFWGGIMSCMATMTKPVTIAPPTGQQFYPAADDFFSRLLPTALTYDDVSLATLYSEILPKDADLTTNLSETLRLQIPIISSDMDTVTESRMAIAMSLNGGLGLIHYNMPAKDQVKEVARVKRHIHGLIQDPITVSVKLSVGDVLAMIEERHFTFRTFPVVDAQGRLAGLLPGSIVKERYRAKKVTEAHDPAGEAHHGPRERSGRRSDQVRRHVFQRTHRHQQNAGRRSRGPPARAGDQHRRRTYCRRGQVAAESQPRRPFPPGGGRRDRAGAETLGGARSREDHRPRRRLGRRGHRRGRGLHGPRSQ